MLLGGLCLGHMRATRSTPAHDATALGAPGLLRVLSSGKPGVWLGNWTLRCTTPVSVGKALLTHGAALRIHGVCKNGLE